MSTLSQSKKIRDFWNARSNLENHAGTDDLILKQLEVKAIISYIKDGLSILDIGCGNGITAIEIAHRFNVSIIGIDFSDKMINAALLDKLNKPLIGNVEFKTGDVCAIPVFNEAFDLIYTERTLINLPNWRMQRQAIVNIASLLKNNGLYIMCEHSQDGLDKMNICRKAVSLSPIVPPWHNRYLRDNELQTANFKSLKLEDINYFSSTYYFLSRIVNAWQASQEKQEPKYEAPVNQLALQLPPIGDFGQGRIWMWRKI